MIIYFPGTGRYNVFHGISFLKFQIMTSRFIKYLVLLLIPVAVISCTPVNDNPASELVKVAQAVSSASSFDVTFFAGDSLFVGYNKVYFKIKDNTSGLAINSATLALHPLMNMGTYSHACPSEPPAATTNAKGYFEGAVLFSMPGTNSWSLSLDVTADGKTETVSFPLDKVVGTTPVKKIVVIDSLSTGPGTWAITKYPMSIVEPAAWKVGINPFEITIHKMESMMSFPCCNDITVEITPEMPSMGHGSPNNVNPVSTGNGHYLGSVNFTMTGAWRVHLLVKKGDRIISTRGYFDIEF